MTLFRFVFLHLDMHKTNCGMALCIQFRIIWIGYFAILDFQTKSIILINELPFYRPFILPQWMLIWVHLQMLWALAVLHGITAYLVPPLTFGKMWKKDAPTQNPTRIWAYCSCNEWALLPPSQSRKNYSEPSFLHMFFKLLAVIFQSIYQTKWATGNLVMIPKRNGTTTTSNRVGLQRNTLSWNIGI